ncbi:hypothetical protein LCGC14_1302660 [marine sediment metagenome]|uniref:Uncharacterized protein n=1 Tax=marine sediment metagenome TaxID=412755 RepID=A0A0F9L9R2_9ZZZZ
MGPPRYHGCTSSKGLNTVVNAYIRAGGKWSVIGTVCWACYAFWRGSRSPSSSPPSSGPGSTVTST